MIQKFWNCFQFLKVTAISFRQNCSPSLKLHIISKHRILRFEWHQIYRIWYTKFCQKNSLNHIFDQKLENAYFLWSIRLSLFLLENRCDELKLKNYPAMATTKINKMRRTHTVLGLSLTDPILWSWQRPFIIHSLKISANYQFSLLLNGKKKKKKRYDGWDSSAHPIAFI